jgi:6-phosphofructokinase 1
MKRALLVHGGGPTAVLNASLAGLAWEARSLPGFPPLWAARHGMDGLFGQDWVDLSGLSDSLLQQISLAPGSVIGSSRRPMQKHEFAQAVDLLDSAGFGFVFLTGGNGTMRCAEGLAREAAGRLQVIGIPKTIDNDIPGMDHTPGYGSVARFFAHAARDLGADNRALPTPVVFLETLGRDTGWVTASTALARTRDDDAPHLIYLPERPVSLDHICADVESKVTHLGRCVVAVCEGQRDEQGQPFGADVPPDRDGVRRLASNLGHTLAQLVADRTGLRTRSEKPGLVGRCFALTCSETDRREAEICGRTAARAAHAGASGVMVALQREPVPPYRPRTELVGLAAGLRHFPLSWITPSGNDVLGDYTDWARPLAGLIEPLPCL